MSNPNLFKQKKLEFLSNLLVKVNHDTEYELTEPFLAKWGYQTISVPRGYTTDFASVPRFPIVYLMVGSTGHKAAVLHDFCYTEPLYTKEEADYLFYQALLTSGISKFKAKLMWMGVKIGGRGNYAA